MDNIDKIGEEIPDVLKITRTEAETFARFAPFRSKITRLADIEHITLFLAKRILTKKGADLRLAAKMGCFIIERIPYRKVTHSDGFIRRISEIVNYLSETKNGKGFGYLYRIFGTLCTSTLNYALARDFSNAALAVIETGPFDIYHRFREDFEGQLKWAEVGLMVRSDIENRKTIGAPIIEDNPYIDNDLLEEIEDKMLEINQRLPESVSREYDPSEF